MSDSLRQRRKALGLSIRNVAERSGVSTGSVYNYETGRPGGVIKNKYQSVLDLYDKLEREKQEQENAES